jgi:hypothetical protein
MLLKTINSCNKSDIDEDSTISMDGEFEDFQDCPEDVTVYDKPSTAEFFNNIQEGVSENSLTKKERTEMSSDNNDKRYLEEQIKRVEQKIDLKDEAINNKIDGIRAKFDTLNATIQHYEKLMNDHVTELKVDQRELRSDIKSSNDKTDSNFKWTLAILFTILAAIIGSVYLK